MSQNKFNLRNHLLWIHETNPTLVELMLKQPHLFFDGYYHEEVEGVTFTNRDDEPRQLIMMGTEQILKSTGETSMCYVYFVVFDTIPQEADTE